MSADSGSMPELLTIADAAELLEVSKSTLRRLQSDRKIPFYKVRGSIRFAKSDIVSYVAKNRVEPIE